MPKEKQSTRKFVLPLVFWLLFAIWVFHLFSYISYDKFAYEGDTVTYTDEGFWNYPARHKYLFGTWSDSKCHYNHRLLATPLYEIIQYMSFKIFGLNYWGLRFPSILFFILTFLLLTFYIVQFRKKDYSTALLVLFPFFIERYLLVRFTAGLLESLLLFLLTLSYILYMFYIKYDKDHYFYASLLFVVIAYFVKSYAILMAVPYILLHKSTLKKKILITIIILLVPALWNIFVRIHAPTTFKAIHYDLYSAKRVKHLWRIITGYNFIDSSFILILPVFWFNIYFIIFKTPFDEIYRKQLLQFDTIVVFYLASVFIMHNWIRYSLPLIPVYVDVAIYLSNKKFSLRKSWTRLFITVLVFYFIMGTSFLITWYHFNSNTLTILSMLTIDILFLLTSNRFKYSLREAIFIALVSGGIMWNSVKSNTPVTFIVVAFYIFIANIFFVFLTYPYNNNSSNRKGIPYILILLILYFLSIPVWFQNEKGYFEGHNNFRNQILNCVKKSNADYDAVSGRGADNIALFTRKKVIETLGPDYAVGSKINDSIPAYNADSSCFKGKKLLVFGYPYKDSLHAFYNIDYIQNYIHSLPINPKHITKIADCHFIYDNNSHAHSAEYKLPIYIFTF